MKNKKIEEIIKKYIEEFCKNYTILKMLLVTKWLRQTLRDFQQEVREETLREILFKKYLNRFNHQETTQGMVYWNKYRDKIISTAKKKYNINLE